jgi:hypothetical protein
VAGARGGTPNESSSDASLEESVSGAIDTMLIYIACGRYELRSIEHPSPAATDAQVSSYAVLVPKSQRTLEGVGTMRVILEDEDDHRFALTQLKLGST